jgi:serine/threonine protein phosphatase PrpC
MRTLVSSDILLFDSAAVTHQGLVRKYNEDSIFSEPARGFWLVADGMGGHKDGNVASAMVVDAAKAATGRHGDVELASVFVNELDQVNLRLVGLANGDDHSLVGSTVAALIIQHGRYTCLWAGDSRCYLVRAGNIRQVSRDHTEVQELVDRGTITPAEALTWPRRNVITRAVGAQADFQADAASDTVESGDCFVLCSDGLTGHVSDAEILDAVSWTGARDACDKLVNLALARGGKDNVSVIVITATRRDAKTVVQSW